MREEQGGDSPRLTPCGLGVVLKTQNTSMREHQKGHTMAKSYDSSGSKTEFAGDIEVGKRQVIITRITEREGDTPIVMVKDADGKTGFLNFFSEQLTYWDSQGINIFSEIADDMANGEFINVTCYKTKRCKL